MSRTTTTTTKIIPEMKGRIGDYEFNLMELESMLVINTSFLDHPEVRCIVWNFVLFHPEIPFYFQYQYNPLSNVLDFHFVKLQSGESVYSHIPSTELMIGLHKQYSKKRGCIIWKLYNEYSFLKEYYDTTKRYTHKVKKSTTIPIVEIGRPGDFNDIPSFGIKRLNFPLLSEFVLTRIPYYFKKAVFNHKTNSIAVSMKQYHYEYSLDIIRIENELQMKYIEEEKEKEKEDTGKLFKVGERVFQVIMTNEFLKDLWI
jgi:hypothetical protein